MSSGDPYEVLGVPRNASPEEIRNSYRRLAKKYHPDLNPGDPSAVEQFKQVSTAYDILGDTEKRARFDRGEIDAEGGERPREQFYRDFAQARGGADRYGNEAGFADFAEFGGADDILSELFGFARRGSRRARGRDVRYRLEVDFLDAVNGASKRLTLPDGSVLDIEIPPGTRDGQTLRLRGKGEPGRMGGAAGDALVEISVRPHPFYTRQGDDIHLELPVSLTEAVLGARIKVPTPVGPVAVKIPRGSSSGRILRLKGKGAPRPGGGRGDEYATLKIMLPPRPDRELERFVESWQTGKLHNPRQQMGF